jgi:hypothetical protein
MSFELKPWQVEPVRHLGEVLRTTGSAIDASFCGAGKTGTAVGICLENGWRAHVICPKPVIPGWRRLLEAAGVEHEVVNYERAIRKPLERKRGTLYIFDEVHRCANVKTKNAKKLIEAAHSGRVLMLSATAVESPLNLGAIGLVLGLFTKRDYWSWLGRYGVRRGFFGGLAWDGKEEHMRKLHDQVFPKKGICLTRNSVPNFPHCYRENLVVDLGSKVKQVYRKLADEAGVKADALFSSVDEEFDLPITKTLRFRQAVEMAKTPMLCELVEDYRASGLSCVVGFSFRESMELAASFFPGCSVIQGGRDNEAERNRFQDGTADVCLIQVDMGVGIDLDDSSGVRPRGVFTCPSDNARSVEQLEGRVWRSSSKSAANIYSVFAADTVEETIHKRTDKKRMNMKVFNEG